MGVGWASLIPGITGRRPGGREVGQGQDWWEGGSCLSWREGGDQTPFKAGAGDSAQGQVLRRRYSQSSLRDPSQSWGWCSEEEVPGSGEHSVCPEAQDS